MLLPPRKSPRCHESHTPSTLQSREPTTTDIFDSIRSIYKKIAKQDSLFSQEDIKKLEIIANTANLTPDARNLLPMISSITQAKTGFAFFKAITFSHYGPTIIENSSWVYLKNLLICSNEELTPEQNISFINQINQQFLLNITRIEDLLNPTHFTFFLQTIQKLIITPPANADFTEKVICTNLLLQKLISLPQSNSVEPISLLQEIGQIFNKPTINPTQIKNDFKKLILYSSFFNKVTGLNSEVQFSKLVERLKKGETHPNQEQILLNCLNKIYNLQINDFQDLSQITTLRPLLKQLKESIFTETPMSQSLIETMFPLFHLLPLVLREVPPFLKDFTEVFGENRKSPIDVNEYKADIFGKTILSPHFCEITEDTHFDQLMLILANKEFLKLYPEKKQILVHCLNSVFSLNLTIFEDLLQIDQFAPFFKAILEKLNNKPEFTEWSLNSLGKLFRQLHLSAKKHQKTETSISKDLTAEIASLFNENLTNTTLLQKIDQSIFLSCLLHKKESLKRSINIINRTSDPVFEKKLWNILNSYPFEIPVNSSEEKLYFSLAIKNLKYISSQIGNNLLENDFSFINELNIFSEKLQTKTQSFISQEIINLCKEPILEIFLRNLIASPFFLTDVSIRDRFIILLTLRKLQPEINQNLLPHLLTFFQTPSYESAKIKQNIKEAIQDQKQILSLLVNNQGIQRASIPQDLVLEIEERMEQLQKLNRFSEGNSIEDIDFQLLSELSSHILGPKTPHASSDFRKCFQCFQNLLFQLENAPNPRSISKQEYYSNRSRFQSIFLSALQFFPERTLFFSPEETQNPALRRIKNNLPRMLMGEERALSSTEEDPPSTPNLRTVENTLVICLQERNRCLKEDAEWIANFKRLEKRSY